MGDVDGRCQYYRCFCNRPGKILVVGCVCLFDCKLVVLVVALLLRKSILWKLVKSQIFELFVNSHITASSVRRS